MAKNWTKSELIFLKNKIEKQGVHPKDFVEEFNKKFETSRTLEAITRKCVREGIKYTHLKPKNFLEHAPNRTIKQQVVWDREKERLQSQLNTFKRLYKTSIKDRNLQDKLIEITKECIQTLPTVPIPKISTVDQGVTTEDVLLLLSDIHAGEVVDASEVNGINEYNTDIMCHRLKFLATSIADIVNNKLTGYKFNKLVIAGLGDWVSGNIHGELTETSEGNVVDWTFGVAIVVAQFMLELAQIFPQIEFVGVVGNHGRLHKKPRFKNRYVNWDYLAYQVLSLLLAKQSNITFKIPKSFWTVHEINGNNFLLLHGDNINSYASIPWYGIERTVTKLKELLESIDQKFDYVCMGHWHNRNILDRVKGELIINGSVIGGNEFSIGKLFTSSLASQHICGVHKKYGCTWGYKVKVQHAPTKGKVPYVYNTEGVMGDFIENLTF